MLLCADTDQGYIEKLFSYWLGVTRRWAYGSCKTSKAIKTQVDVDGSGFLEFPEFCLMMHKKLSDTDTENELKETFRVFSKDDEGCITAEELKFVLTHLPGKVTNALQYKNVILASRY